MTQPNTSPSHPFRWFPEFLELGSRRLRPQARLLGLALVVGVVAGVGAIAFTVACQVVVYYALDVVVGYRPHVPGGEPALFVEGSGPFRPWLLLLVPAVGGLLSGWLVYTLAPAAEGHGTDSAIDSYHRRGGYIAPLVPFVKIVASALTIGTGGSGGREGPIAQIGAGVGSLLGGMLRLRPADRRVLMAAGMGAGVAAIFRAPLAGALFAAEVMYRSPDFESEVIIPAGLACVTAYCTFGLAFGWAPLFTLPDAVVQSLTFTDPLQLGAYLLLALFMAILAMLYTRTFYGLTHWLHRLPVAPKLRPAVGALLTGGVGVGLYALLGGDSRVLAVLSFGYGVLQDALAAPPGTQATLSLALVLLLVAVGKIVTTGLTIGSGGSGGVFGPSMVIGGCGGGALGIVLHHLWPPLVPHPATFVVVGMAGFFAAAAKTPFSTLVMVGELTGNYNLLLPALWVCLLAFLLSDEQSIYSSQVENRSRSPAHQGSYVREVLAGLTVRHLLPPTPDVDLLRPGDRLPEVAKRLSETPYLALPVADSDGRLLGVVGVEEVMLAAQLPGVREYLVATDLMQSGVTPLIADDGIDRALELFVASGLMALPVVTGADDRRIVGLVKRADVSTLYLRHVHAPSA